MPDVHEAIGDGPCWPAAGLAAAVARAWRRRPAGCGRGGEGRRSVARARGADGRQAAASRSRVRPAAPAAEPFDPPPLEALDRDAKWIDRPVQDGLADAPRAAGEGARRSARSPRPWRSRTTPPRPTPRSSRPSAGCPEPGQADLEARIDRHVAGDLGSTNPIMISSSAEFDILGLTGFGLFSFDRTLEPFANAETVVSWQTSADGLYDKVVIRDDLVWSDGNADHGPRHRLHLPGDHGSARAGARRSQRHRPDAGRACLRRPHRRVLPQGAAGDERLEHQLPGAAQARLREHLGEGPDAQGQPRARGPRGDAGVGRALRDRRRGSAARRSCSGGATAGAPCGGRKVREQPYLQGRPLPDHRGSEHRRSWPSRRARSTR